RPRGRGGPCPRNSPLTRCRRSAAPAIGRGSAPFRRGTRRQTGEGPTSGGASGAHDSRRPLVSQGQLPSFMKFHAGLANRLGLAGKEQVPVTGEELSGQHPHPAAPGAAAEGG